MAKWSRRIAAGLLGVVLTFGAGCSSNDVPAEPASQPVAGTSSEQFILGGDLFAQLKDLRLLSCTTQPQVRRTQVVGAKGGTILIGTHRLVIPAGALKQDVTITAEQVPGRVNSVRFLPEGLKFDRPATLSLSYANCSRLLLLKRVVYVDELLRILELLPSLDNRDDRTVTGSIRHFSRYAVAW
jgi:hypothetical protein